MGKGRSLAPFKDELLIAATIDFPTLFNTPQNRRNNFLKVRGDDDPIHTHIPKGVHATTT